MSPSPDFASPERLTKLIESIADRDWKAGQLALIANGIALAGCLAIFRDSGDKIGVGALVEAATYFSLGVTCSIAFLVASWAVSRALLFSLAKEIAAETPSALIVSFRAKYLDLPGYAKLLLNTVYFLALMAAWFLFTAGTGFLTGVLSETAKHFP